MGGPDSLNLQIKPLPQDNLTTKQFHNQIEHARREESKPTGASASKSFNAMMISAGFTYGGLANYLFEYKSVDKLYKNTNAADKIYRMLPRTDKWLFRERYLFGTAAALATINSFARSYSKYVKAQSVSEDGKSAQDIEKIREEKRIAGTETLAGLVGGLSAVAVLMYGSASKTLARKGVSVSGIQAASYTSSFVLNYLAYRGINIANGGKSENEHKEAMNASLLNATVNWATVGVNAFYIKDSNNKYNNLSQKIWEKVKALPEYTLEKADELFKREAGEMTDTYGRHPRLLSYFAKEKHVAKAVAAAVAIFSAFKTYALIARADGKTSESSKNDAYSSFWAGLGTAGFGLGVAVYGAQVANWFHKKGVRRLFNSTVFHSTFVGMIGGAALYFGLDYLFRSTIYKDKN